MPRHLTWVLCSSPVFIQRRPHQDIVAQHGILDPGVLCCKACAASHTHSAALIVHLPKQRCQQARLACAETPADLDLLNLKAPGGAQLPHVGVTLMAVTFTLA